MGLEKIFCSSPWLHMRIHNDGSFGMCRWAKSDSNGHNVADTSVQQYFQRDLANARRSLLQGQALPNCTGCLEQERYGKVSGRQRQLLKIGVRTDNWHKTVLSSPWFQHFANSDGTTDQMPVDWQIDLGNACNSACVFCRPEFSTRLAHEQVNLGIISSMAPRSWCDNPATMSAFLKQLADIPHIKYIHFIGGEPLVIPAFTKILQALVDNGMASSVTVGFTTNLTIYDDQIADLLAKFQQVNLGLSVECFEDLNDYVRYPSEIQKVRYNADRWVECASRHSWLAQIRVTPTWLTVGRLLTVFDWAWQQGVSVESCNFLQEPDCFRPSVLPLHIRQQIVEQFRVWINHHSDQPQAEHVINTRHPDLYKIQLVQDLESYVDFLERAPDQTKLMNQAVQRLKLYESRRKNCVLDYLPEYESILRSHGY